MEFSKMVSTPRFPLFLFTLIFLNSCLDLASAAYPPDYYGGSDVSDQTEGCEVSYLCEDLCGDGEDSLCSGNSENLNCFCHQPINLAGANGYTCGETTTSVEAGADDQVSSGNSRLENCVAAASQDFRSRQEVTLCTAGGDVLCFFTDFLNEIPVEVSFLGKDVIYNCDKFRADACAAFCGGESLVACIKGLQILSQCLCKEPPANVNDYTCTKTDTVTSSTVPRDGGSVVDDCQKQAVDLAFRADVQVFTCEHEELRTYCIFQGVLPDQPETTTTTTTQAPTTTPAPISLEVGGSVKCKSCESDGTILSLLVCTILCTVETVVRSIKSIITGVLQVATALLGYIPELLLEVVNAIGDL